MTDDVPGGLRRKRPRCHGDFGSLPGVHGTVPAGKELRSKVRIAAHNKGSVGKGVHARGGTVSEKLKAPFPYFGGKSRVAALVWERIGDVDNFIEPFCGSAAVLLARPHPPRVETVNDKDCYIANFWRATARDPGAVAEHADWPVNEADLHARHRHLVLSDDAAEFRRRVRQEPDYFDARVAGWWCWGACCWIGGGWCQAPEDRDPDGRVWTNTENVPAISHTGKGVQSGSTVAGLPQKRPTAERCRTGGKGVHGVGPDLPDGNRPQLADAYSRGRGVHNDNHLADGRRPKIDEGVHYGNGIHAKGPGPDGTCEQRRLWLLDWFGRLRDRLRTVRVCCGNWLRVCDSESVTVRLGTTGVFLDPPYPTHGADGSESRAAGLYATDGSRDALDALRNEVLAWCKDRGPDPRMRIVVAGYDTDGYAALCREGWEEIPWKASGGYGNRSAKGKANAGRERLWCSPGCNRPAAPGLFDALED